MEALWRNPGALGSGQVWRLLTPVARRGRAHPIRIEAGLAIPLAVLDTALGDIHGLPFLAGLAVAWFWQRRDQRIGLDSEPPAAPAPSQSGYSSLRQARGSSGCGLGVRSSRNEKYGATNGSGAITW
jgi:hypothetical protein